MPLRKVISGGQTGVDQIGLKVARRLGITTGGTAPKGWKTEDGSKPHLADFGLVESWSNDYAVRTTDNVYDSDATVIFANDLDSPGTICTIKAIKKHKRPYITNPTTETLVDFLRRYDVSILNVAGNRGSRLADEQRFNIGTTLFEALKFYKQECTT